MCDAIVIQVMCKHALLARLLMLMTLMMAFNITTMY